MARQKDPIKLFHKVLKEHDAIFSGLNNGSKKLENNRSSLHFVIHFAFKNNPFILGD